MPEDNVTLARRFYDAWNSGDMRELHAGQHRDVAWVMHPPSPNEGRYEGHEGIDEFRRRILELWEYFDVEPVELRAEDDRVIALARLRGLGKTSRVEVSTRAAHVFTFRQGRVVRFDSYIEPTPATLRALGLDG